MSFLRNVIRDLVDKRLWPVAVALVLALAVVPLVLGGGGDGGGSGTDLAATATAAGAGSGDGAARAQVSELEAQAAGRVSRHGKARDPFVQHHLPKAAPAASAGGTSVLKSLASALHATTGTTGTSGTASTGTGGATRPLVTTTPKVTAPKTDTTNDSDAQDTYSVTLKFGEAGAEKTYNNVARLTPLPSADNPFFVFLGLKSDGKSAVFLVDADAVPSGDGTCEPNTDDCEQVVLKKGDIEFFELQSGTAGVVQYQLELKDIKMAKAATKASAARAHTRESKAGREYIRNLVADDPTALDGWGFDNKLGLLVAKEPAVANIPADVADAADGQAPADTSTVLTVPTPAPQP
jgi:hypothetical protein